MPMEIELFQFGLPRNPTRLNSMLSSTTSYYWNPNFINTSIRNAPKSFQFNYLLAEHKLNPNLRLITEIYWERERERAYGFVTGRRSGWVAGHRRGYGVEMGSLFLWFIWVCVLHYASTIISSTISHTKIFKLWETLGERRRNFWEERQRERWEQRNHNGESKRRRFIWNYKPIPF